ncbi:MAG: HEAT repeat domain-containing protein, partial [Gemmataceae bacterium]
MPYNTVLVALLSTAGFALGGPPSPQDTQRYTQIEATITAAGSVEFAARRLHEFLITEPISDNRWRAMEVLVPKLAATDREKLLIATLENDRDSGIRSLAAKQLGRFGTRASFHVLSTAAQSDPTTLGIRGCIGGESNARPAALLALGELGRREVPLREAIRKTLLDWKPEGKNLADQEITRQQSLYVLTGEERWIQPFRAMLDSPEAAMRHKGLYYHTPLKLMKAPPRALELLDDADVQVRLSASFLLGTIADPATIPFLLDRIQDKKRSVDVRCDSIRSLQMMKAHEAIPALRTLAADKDEHLRLIAAMALFTIGGEKTPGLPKDIA